MGNGRRLFARNLNSCTRTVTAQVEQFFQNNVEKSKILALGKFVAAQVKLNAAAAVLKVKKKRFAGLARSHDAARQGYFLEVEAVYGTVVKYVFAVVGDDVGGHGRHVEHVGRVGVYAEFAQYLQ